MKVLNSNSFTTVDTYHGILPFLPPTGNYDTPQLRQLIGSVANEGNHFSGQDTYEIGKQLNRIAQLLPLAQVANDSADLNNLQSSLQSYFQSWFTASGNPGLFYYDRPWGTLIGYPAGYGSDTALNDHHFHYGYWIHSAALLGLFQPNWIQLGEWGGMVNMLGQDIATPVRNDKMFPFLRHFDVYGGHSWASGQAPFGDGVNEESLSEAVNAWAGLILFASEAGNVPLRDAAIWMYTLDTNAAFDYWFNDGPVPSFPAGFNRVEVANVFDGKSDTGTWFGAEPEFEHGIEFLPFTGASLYLGRDPGYSQRNIAEVNSLDGGTFDIPGSTNWPDLMEMYEAFYDPGTAINQWANTTYVFDGESQPHEYYWLHELQALGQVDESVTANTPFYSVFRMPSGAVAHVAFNIGQTPITVNFSDGATLTVAPGTLASEFGTVTLPIGSAAPAQSGPAPACGTSTPLPPSPTPPPTSAGTPLYLIAGATVSNPGALSLSPGTGAESDVIPADNGVTYDGTPTNPLVYFIKGLNGTYNGAATQFSLYVDAGTAVANGVQLQILYDTNGDGTFERTETYHYFATAPLPDFQNYTQSAGLESSSGQLGNMTNGTVLIKVWNAIGTNPSFLNASATSSQGQQSVIVLPFNNVSASQ